MKIATIKEGFNMRWVIVLCITGALVGGVRADCDACLDGWCYKKHILPKETGGRSGDIDRNTNMLYVTNYPSEDRIKQCNLATGTCNLYPVEDIRKIVVDQRTGAIYGNNYWGGSIYRFDLANNKEYLVVSNVKTWDIQFKDKLYYAVEYGGIYTYENGVSRVVPGTQDYNVPSFVVDNNNDIYFTYLNGGQSHMRRLSGQAIVDDKFLENIKTVTVDKYGNALFFDYDIISYSSMDIITHVYKRINGHYVEVGAMKEWPYGEPLFDNDNNLVYSYSSIDPYTHLKKDSILQCSVENNTIHIRAQTGP